MKSDWIPAIAVGGAGVVVIVAIRTWSKVLKVLEALTTAMVVTSSNSRHRGSSSSSNPPAFTVPVAAITPLPRHPPRPRHVRLLDTAPASTSPGAVTSSPPLPNQAPWLHRLHRRLTLLLHHLDPPNVCPPRRPCRGDRHPRKASNDNDTTCHHRQDNRP